MLELPHPRHVASGARDQGPRPVHVVADLAAGACALLFLAAALGKVDSWRQWYRLTEEFPGAPLLRGAARVVIPAIEGSIVLLSFATPSIGLAAGAVVLACFAIAVSLLARRLSGHECNCFGVIAPATISPRLGGRNIGLAIVALAGWLVSHHERQHALSLGKVLATILVGTITLMLFQYWRLRGSARTLANFRAEEAA